MKILLLGKSGQLGAELEKVLSGEHQILEVDYKAIELSNLEKSAAKIQALDPDLILNAAAWTDVDEAETNKDAAIELNSIWPNHLSLCAKQLRVPFFHFSTDYVFAGDKMRPLEIDEPKNPKSIYGQTKSMGEDVIIKNYPENSYIIRTAWLYSSFRRNFVKSIIKSLITNKEHIEVVNDQVGQPTSARDLAGQVKKMICIRPKPRIYHATNSGQATWFEFAQEISRLIGEKIGRAHV